MKYSQDITIYKKRMRMIREVLKSKYGVRFISAHETFLKREYSLKELLEIGGYISQILRLFELIKSLEIKGDKFTNE